MEEDMKELQSKLDESNEKNESLQDEDSNKIYSR